MIPSYTQIKIISLTGGKRRNRTAIVLVQQVILENTNMSKMSVDVKDGPYVEGQHHAESCSEPCDKYILKIKG
jgi:hypothetical protein